MNENEAGEQAYMNGYAAGFEAGKRYTDSNPYWKNICKIAEKQRNKGVSAYGCGIEDNPAGILTRIEHLQEELVDALMYCEWLKDYLGGAEDG